MGPEPGSPLNWRLFELPFGPWLRLQLSGIHVELDVRSTPDPARPLILVANHTSWFDGFLVRELQRRLRPRSNFRTVMLERELRGRPVLRALGGTGFDPERPQSFRAAVRELRDRVSRGPLTVAFFPQGRIRPSWARPLDFRPGLRLLQRVLEPADLVPVALHLEPGAHRRPTAYISAGPVLGSGAGGSGPDGTLPSVDEVEAAVGVQLDRILEHVSRFGEDASDQWPPSGVGHG